MVTTIHPLSLEPLEPEPEEWAELRALSLAARTRDRTPSVTASSALARTPPAPPCPLQWATPSDSSQRSILVCLNSLDTLHLILISLQFSASTFTAAAAQHPTLPPGYAYFYGGVGGMPGLQYGGGVAGGGVYPGQHPGIPVPTAAGPTSTSQFQNKAAYGNR